MVTCLVPQIGDVKVIRGQVVGRTPTGATPPASPLKAGLGTKTSAAAAAAARITTTALTATQGEWLPWCSTLIATTSASGWYEALQPVRQ